eukprot:1166782-Rhodomonas_salina.2
MPAAVLSATPPVPHRTQGRETARHDALPGSLQRCPRAFTNCRHRTRKKRRERERGSRSGRGEGEGAGEQSGTSALQSKAWAEGFVERQDAYTTARDASSPSSSGPSAPRLAGSCAVSGPNARAAPTLMAANGALKLVESLCHPRRGGSSAPTVAVASRSA